MNPSLAIMEHGTVGYLIVTFVNEDSEPHDIRSNPHPGHTTCALLNLGVIAPGQRLDTPILSPCAAGLAGLDAAYHDETRPDDPRFRGVIR